MGCDLRASGYWDDVSPLIVEEPITRADCGLFFCRYAEMPSDQKNKISHRGKALEKLRAYLQSLP